MPDKNGLDTARELREKYPDIIIIFVSSHKEYVFDAFRCEAFHFIVKPIRDSEFTDVFGRALNKYKMLNSTYTVTWRNSRSVLRINDITYIEGYCRRLKVHTATEEYEQIGKVSTAYKALAGHGFLMIHQSFIVNMQHISHFGKEFVTLIDDTKVPIASRKRPEALKQFDLFLKKRKW